MDALQTLLGETLLTAAGPAPTARALAGKTAVALYFSAHWCPPCRGFTPAFAENYTKAFQAKGLEVVFVSSDRDEESFSSYFKDMPWTALPYSDRDRKEALSKKFKVQGIPTLVILGMDGSVITKDGRSAVTKDPTGEQFPWKPVPLTELLAGDYQGKDGVVKADTLKDKVLGIYFSAHWCPPCRGFTPQLVEQYKKIQAAGLPLEIIFASSDRDESAFDEYYKEMPWITLPYADRARKEALSDHFGVNGIPTLVLLDTDRSVITDEGRGAIMRDLAEFPWHPKPVSNLAEGCPGINECVAVILLAETAGSEAQVAGEAAMTPLAEEYLAAAKAADEDPEVRFYIAKGSGGPVPMIRSKCSLPPCLTAHEHPVEEGTGEGWCCDGCGGNTLPRFRCTKGCDFDFCATCNAKVAEGPVTLPAQIVVLDIPDKGAFYTPSCATTTDGLRAMLGELKAKALTRRQLQ